MITLLNTSVLTNYGEYTYVAISLGCAREMVRNEPYQSAIGHQSTADILTELLGLPVVVNRITYAQQAGETALVFKLKGRAPEGVILDRPQLEAMGYEFGLLVRLA